MRGRRALGAGADEKVDAALIEVTSATWEAPASWSGDGRTQRSGKLVTTLRAGPG